MEHGSQHCFCGDPDLEDYPVYHFPEGNRRLTGRQTGRRFFGERGNDCFFNSIQWVYRIKDSNHINRIVYKKFDY